MIQLSNQKQAPLLSSSSRKTPAQQGASSKFDISLGLPASRSLDAFLNLSNFLSGVRRRYNDKKRTISESSWKAKKKARDRKDSDASSQDSRPSSPTASPASSEQNSHHSSAAHRRRRSEANAYDINNIVIPYSIAAATRVEKLQYKEIITPQWRITEPQGDCQNGTKEPPQMEKDEEIEDISDQIFKERHDKCEVEEKRRIINCVDPNNRRGRSSRSRLDSERHNSVSNGEIPGLDTASQDCENLKLVAADTPQADLPSGPFNGIASESESHSTPSKISDRRRTSSLSKRDENEDETFEVPPFEPRVFPLSDDQYSDMLSKCSHAQEMRELQNKQLGNSELSNASNASSSNSTKISTRSSVPKDSIQPPQSRASSANALEEAGNLGDDEMEDATNATDEVDDPDWNPPQAASE